MNSLFLTDLHKDRKLLNAEGESAANQMAPYLWSQFRPYRPADEEDFKYLFDVFDHEERINQTVEITKHTVDIEEKGVKLKLTIVDTPGFGDAVNNTEWWAFTSYTKTWSRSSSDGKQC